MPAPPPWLALLALIPAGSLTYVAVVGIADRAAIRRFAELSLIGVKGSAPPDRPEKLLDGALSRSPALYPFRSA